MQVNEQINETSQHNVTDNNHNLPSIKSKGYEERRRSGKNVNQN